MTPQVLPGQLHTLMDCVCCHADAVHNAFPNGAGAGEVVLCQDCLAEKWEPLRASAATAVEAARAAVSSNPGDDGNALVLEFCEGSLDLFNSKNGDVWDLPRLTAACARIAAAQAAIAALASFHSKEPKGSA
jgi:hypothetical protein